MSCDDVYALIGNIPSSYHSKDLRNYFSHFIESDGFECFHFRHRPEYPERQTSENVVSSEKPNETNERHCDRNELPTATPGSKSGHKKKTTCCVVKLGSNERNDFVKFYHKKHWLDRQGNSMRTMCNIAKIKIDEPVPASIERGGVSINPYKTRLEQKNALRSREVFTKEDLHSLPELHPPDIMPKGNVGTPSRIFLNSIKECRLPPAVIKKLGLTFPRTKCRKYGRVAFDYKGVMSEREEKDDETIVRDGQGNVIEAENPDIEKCIQGKAKEREKLKELEEEEKETERNRQQDPDSGDDNDTCEEWERHEALYDDPSNQERNKERLYEEEIELKWEKGGSGLVFYTDAQFWEEREAGDFDEQTADDWDVDMSVYYEENGGDKDSRDYVQMRREKQRREGLVLDSVFRKKGESSGIGKFEKYTKGIGRRIMEQKGWKDGQGLGNVANLGISEALENEGQKPRDKSGFGYRGEKLNRYVGIGRKRQKTSDFVISTIYDDPRHTDPPESVFRRSEPYTISHRQEFSKAFDSS